MSKQHFPIKIGTLLNLSLVLVSVAAAITIVVLVNRTMGRQALVEAESKARILLDRNMATHTYFSQLMKPRLFEWTAPFRSIDYFDPAWMSSTYAIRRIDAYFQSLNPAGYYVKDAAVNARYPDNEADGYERAFLEELNKDSKLAARSEVRMIDGQPFLAVLRRGEVMEESCLHCHGDPANAPGDLVREYGPERSFNRQVGEIVSVISLRVPLSIAFTQADRVSWQLSGLLLLFLSALFFAQFWISRRVLLTPVKMIRDKALQIVNDETYLGEVIPLPFGSELKELTATFNSLSVGLRSSRDHLEERISERTADLNASNRRLEHEIAERRQAEEALRQERDYAQSLVETAQTIVLVLDTEGRIVRFNAYLEEITAYSLSEVRGADWFATFLPERDRIRTREVFTRALSDIQTRGNVNPIVTKDGREREIEWYDKTLKTADGTVVGLLCIGQDMTERVQAEKERERLIAELRDALTNIKILRGLLPICSSCKKIRDDQGYWHQIEAYIYDHTEADFSHGICPECALKLYPDYKQKT